MKALPTLSPWYFPLPRPHTGVPLANGTQGLLLWGVNALNLTVSRAGFWDHRGGNTVLDTLSFATLRACLEANDEAEIRRLFACPDVPNTPKRPYQIGGGRLTLRFSGGMKPREAALRIKDGTVTVRLADAAGNEAFVVLRQAIDAEVAFLEFDEAALARLERVEQRPSWDFVGEELGRFGVPAVERWSEGGDVPRSGGFEQKLPQDPALAVAWRIEGNRLSLATALADEARSAAERTLAQADFPRLLRTAQVWWKRYWKCSARVYLPDEELMQAYYLGLFKQACLNSPHAPAATLQGPWMEETQIPPWSNDYHFNINAQLVYGPALATNHADHYRPLIELLKAWLPRMQRYGETFFGRPGAMLLPHAVDDQGQVIGNFWSGTIDHACTAWVADCVWKYYLQTLEEPILHELVLPLLTGAFEGFWAMLEEIPGGGLRLPVSVSPEFGTGSIRGRWGCNASFQLAAIHRLVRVLPEAARRAGQPADVRWARVERELPPYSTYPMDPAEPDGPRQRIALWEGQDLSQCHRHHSHLAGIWPFATLDVHDPRHEQNVAHSIYHWNLKGSGEWTGWCTPWAAIICARCGLPDAALLWLKWWKALFTNIGHGSLHNADFSGVTGWHDGSLWQPGWALPPNWDREIMQIDGAMAAVSAILEMLVQDHDTEICIVERFPRLWREFAFEGVRVSGGFLLAGVARDGHLMEVTVTSLFGERLKLRHGLGTGCRVDGELVERAWLETATRRGQVLRLSRAPLD